METIAYRPSGPNGQVLSTGQSLAASCIGGDDFRAPEVEAAYGGDPDNWDAAAEYANHPASDIWSMGMIFLLIITELRNLEQVGGGGRGCWCSIVHMNAILGHCSMCRVL